MATETLVGPNWLQVTVDPFAPMRDQISTINDPLARASLNKALDTLANGLKNFLISIEVDLSKYIKTDGGAPPPPAIDPLEALEKIAAAINKAETTLNKQNLIIAGGRVETSLDVNIGGASAAHSTIVFNITPNPYNSNSETR
jgi:hypothetical protein